MKYFGPSSHLRGKDRTELQTHFEDYEKELDKRSANAHSADIKDEELVRYLRREASLLLREHAVRWHRKDIEGAVLNNDIVIITGAPGCGKSTQVPIFVSELDCMKDKIVLCTQPYRMAADELSKYVRNIYNGYCHRVYEQLKSVTQPEYWDQLRACNEITLAGAQAFDGSSGVALLDTACKGAKDKTRIAYASEVNVINAYRIARENFTHNKLGDKNALVPDASVGCLVLDEAHTRSVESDILLSLVLEAVFAGIKVVIMSATINSEALEDYFFHWNNDNKSTSLLVKTVHITDKRNWVDVQYKPPLVSFAAHTLANSVVHTISDCLQGNLCGPLTGNVLVFLPTDNHVEQAKNLLEISFSARIMPYNASFRTVTLTDADARLKPAENLSAINNHANKHCDYQRENWHNDGGAFAARGPKFIVYLATEFAETSLTIDGVTVVIDSGLRSASNFNPKTNLVEITLKPISKASA